MNPGKILATILVSLAVAALHAQGNDLRLSPEIRDIAGPAGTLPVSFDIVGRGGDAVTLAWAEKDGDKGSLLKVAAYLSDKSEWTRPSVAGRSLSVAGTILAPKLALGEKGRLALLWTDSQGESAARLLVALSEDGGLTWSSPRELGTGKAIANPSFSWANDGSWTAAWLDLDGETAHLKLRKSGETASRDIEGAEAFAAAATETASFPDGTDLIAYRGLPMGTGCDPWIARRYEGSWTLQTVGRERWMGRVDPTGAMSLSFSAPRVALAWFTAADDEPRILMSSSPDAGERWTQVARADLGHAVGSPDLVLLSDGSMLLSWIEAAGGDTSMPAGLLLRRYSSGGGSIQPAYLVKEEPANFSTRPRLALLRETQGKSTELILAYGLRSESGLRFKRLKMPSPEALAEVDGSCHCSGSTLPGFPIRGRIMAVDVDRALLRLEHNGVPGMFRRGELEVKVNATVVAAVRVGRGIMGRIERSGDAWLMSDLRTYAIP